MDKEALMVARGKDLQRETALLGCNDVSQRYGMVLSAGQVRLLVAQQNAAVRSAGRVLVGRGVLEKLAFAFCDSPYIPAAEYADTLGQLCELFYHFKNQTGERLSDEELVDWMQQAFNGRCKGSLDLLCHRELEGLADRLRGKTPEEQEESDEDGTG